MRKAVARAALVAAVSTVFIWPAAGAQAATATASQGTTASRAHPCDIAPSHPACRWHHHHHHHGGRLINVDLI